MYLKKRKLLSGVVLLMLSFFLMSLNAAGAAQKEWREAVEEIDAAHTEIVHSKPSDSREDFVVSFVEETELGFSVKKFISDCQIDLSDSHFFK